MRFAVVAMLICFLAYHIAGEVRPISDILSPRPWLTLAYDWSAIGMVLVLAFMWVAAMSAQDYALARLATGVLERRNWVIATEAGGKVKLANTHFEEYVHVSLREAAALAASALVPALALAALHGLKGVTVILWIVIFAALARAVAEFLRMRENVADLDQRYGARHRAAAHHGR
jgi:hypothetical protein